MGSIPHNKNRNTVHYQHHDRHHKGHGAVNKQVCPGQIPVGAVKPLFFMFLCAEGADYRQSGQNLTGNEIQFIYKILENLKFRHGHNKEHQDYQRDQDYGKSNNPGHGHICLEHLNNSAYGQNRRIEHNPQKHYRKQLNLLDIIGASRNQRSGGEMVKLIV